MIPSLLSRWPALLATCFAALIATEANAQYSKMVVLSDSMSDTGRYFKVTKALFGQGDPAPPAFEGRFCDGPVAVEVLASQLNVAIENYAFSGALSGYLNLIPGVPLGVLSQITEHLNRTSLVPLCRPCHWWAAFPALCPAQAVLTPRPCTSSGQALTTTTSRAA